MRARAAAIAVLLALTTVACGDDAKDEGTVDDAGKATVTIYSSMPLRGPSAAVSESIVNAEKLALSQAGGRVNAFVVKYVSLDDSAGPEGWEPRAVGAAARRAAQDRTTIGVLGDLDSGASAISIPVNNEAGILQISPTNTAVGLTRAEGADKGEPEKYYPSGRRTFGRVVPADDRQAAVQLTLQQDEGCKSVFLLHDSEAVGKGIVDQLKLQAPLRGLRVVGDEGIDPEAEDYDDITEDVKAAGADCVFFGGRTRSNAAQLFSELHAALPSARLFGSDGVADANFAAALTPKVARQVRLTTPALPARMYPPAGRRFLRAYEAEFGEPPEPMAIYGYAAMRLMLAAIDAAGEDGDDKEAVVDAFFRLPPQESVLGRYAIDARGDTSLDNYAVVSVTKGRLVFGDRVAPGSTR